MTPLPRTPPYSEAVEAALLSTALLSEQDRVEILTTLTPQDFYLPFHSQIFSGIQAVMESGQNTVDLPMVYEAMRSAGWEGEASTLAGILNVPVLANAEDGIRILMEKTALRQLLKTTLLITSRCYSNGDAASVIEQAQVGVNAIAVGGGKKPHQTLLEVNIAVSEALDAPEKTLRIYTGIPELDTILQGVTGPDLIIIGARPAMGKTALLQGIIRYNGRHMVPGLIFSMEMSGAQLAQRWVAMETGVPAWKLRAGNLTEQERHQVEDAFGKTGEWPVYIDDSGDLSLSDFRKRARAAHRIHGIEYIGIDYAQLMSIKNRESRHEEVAAISRGVKAAAKELNIPIFILCQLNRMLEQRADKRPTLADLRETGQFEQDADVVLFPYRDEVYNPETAIPGQAEIIVAKHRNGPTGVAKTNWVGQRTSFEGIAPGRPFSQRRTRT